MRVGERIPLHAHSDLNDGGTLSSATIHRIIGALSGGGSIGGSVDTNGFETKIAGGQSTIDSHGNVGSALSIDPAAGNVHTLTLTADCTATIMAAAGDGEATLELWVSQDTTGGWALVLGTDGGSFSWDGSTPTLPTTASSTCRIVVERVPGTTNDWIGVMIGGASTSFATPAIVMGTAAAAGVASTTIRSDATIVVFDTTAPANVAAVGVASSTGSTAKAARRDHAHALTYHDEPLTDGASNLIFDGGDIIVVTGVPN